jgi:hypothetical protein
VAGIADSLFGSGVFCALVLPALGNPPSLASVASQTGTGSRASLSIPGDSPSHVLIVDDNGTGHYSQIQYAVDFAHDGDTILVKHGYYGGFTVLDKALVIVGDGESVYLTGAVEADDLEQGKVLTLAHLRVTSPVGTTALSLANDGGRVRLDHCTFIAGDGLPPAGGDGGDGVVVDHCADVAFSHCTMRGGGGQPGWADGTPGPGISGRGISAASSLVAIHESVVTGGTGVSGNFSYWDGGVGNDACGLTDSTLYAEADSFTGGNGGTADFSECLGAMGGNAGYGLHALSGSVARLLRNTVVGGTPGCSSGPLCSPECDPQLPPRSGAGFSDLPGWAAFLSVPTPVHESTTVQITVTGRQGDTVYLVRSGTTRDVYFPEMGSVSLVRPWRPEDVFRLGTLPGNDVPVTFSLGLDDLGPGVDARTIYLQVMLRAPSEQPRLSGMSALVVLDSAF